MTSLVVLTGLQASAQGQPDLEFLYPIPSPAFGKEKGPVVCFDAGHQNYHTPEEAYRPFVDLLLQDGYRTHILRGAFNEQAIDVCDGLVITTPVHPANRDDWAFPHASAFETAEIRSLHGWVRSGGGLFLIIDHSPIPGAAADLLAILGVAVFDGEARNDPRNALPDLFTQADGGLADHAITRGRAGFELEAVSKVATWTGSAFLASRELEPILRYGPRSRMWAELPDTLPALPRREFPVFEIDGWLAAAARPLGEGRVVVLAEASACTALVGDRGPKGMNTKEGAENARFCLNSIRWLTNVLD